MRNFGMHSNEIMKKLKNSDEGAVFYAFSFWIYRGINFCGYKIQKYISSNIEKVRKKQMKYLYMNEQERQMQYYQFPKFLLELQLSQNARKEFMTEFWRDADVKPWQMTICRLWKTFWKSRTISEGIFIVMDKEWAGGGGNFTVAKRKLNYRFHNPNPVEVTADYILKVMIEANTEKVEKILRENMVQMETNECELE